MYRLEVSEKKRNFATWYVGVVHHRAPANLFYYLYLIEFKRITKTMNTAALRRHQLLPGASANLVGGHFYVSIVLTEASSHQFSMQSGNAVRVPLVLLSADSGSAGSVSPALSFMERLFFQLFINLFKPIKLCSKNYN